MSNYYFLILRFRFVYKSYESRRDIFSHKNKRNNIVLEFFFREIFDYQYELKRVGKHRIPYASDLNKFGS